MRPQFEQADDWAPAFAGDSKNGFCLEGRSAFLPHRMPPIWCKR